VSKDRTPAQHPVKHLVCYRIRGDRVERFVSVKNQFGKEILEAIRPKLLCVPSLKIRLGPAYELPPVPPFHPQSGVTGTP
jgi:hypothetical protein